MPSPGCCCDKLVTCGFCTGSDFPPGGFIVELVGTVVVTLPGPTTVTFDITGEYELPEPSQNCGVAFASCGRNSGIDLFGSACCYGSLSTFSFGSYPLRMAVCIDGVPLADPDNGNVTLTFNIKRAGKDGTALARASASAYPVACGTVCNYGPSMTWDTPTHAYLGFSGTETLDFSGVTVNVSKA